MSKRFIHKSLKRYDLPRVEIDGERHYIAPDGTHLRSVTTILSDLKTGVLDAWKKRVGEEAAERIKTKAALRGSRVHALCESFLLNENIDYRRVMPSDMDTFRKIKDALIFNVGTVYGVELRLFSYDLRCAGTTDIFCEWNGVPSIVDFKTAKREKKEDELLSYFIQEACYARMIEELYEMECKQIVTILAIDHEFPQIIVRKREDYDDLVTRIFKENNNEKNTTRTSHSPIVL